MTHMGCIDKIRSHASTYSRSQRAIAQYILNSPDHATSQSIYQMATEIGTSTSSITRFCRKLGYGTLRELRNDLISDVDKQAVNDFERVLNWSDSLNSFATQYLDCVNDVCKQTLEINSMDTFEEVAEDISRARSVYLFGIGASSIAARNLLGKLVKLKVRCIYESDADMAVQMADSAAQEDMAISFSYSGHSHDVLRASRNARKNGCHVTAVVHKGESPLLALSDNALLLPPVEQLTRVTTLFSNYTQSLVVDVLFVLVARKMGTDPSTMLKEYRSIMSPAGEV